MQKENPFVKHYMFLTYHLRPSIQQIIKYLHDEQIISREKAEKMISQAADTMKVQHLLDNLKTFGEENSDALYAATLHAKVWPAADVLEPSKRPHKDLDEAPPLPLPDEWPEKEHNEILKSGKLDVLTVDPKDTKMMEYYKNPAKFSIYKMNNKVRGRVLIINNKTFTHHKERLGTEHDCRGLDIVFRKLGFLVKIESDQTAQQMDDLIDEECKVDHTDYNCFILVILTHGSKGIVYGKDGNPKSQKGDFEEGPQTYLRIDKIQEKIASVKSLQSKPKLFIIQACRGRGKTQNVSSGVPGAGDHSDEEDNPVEADDLDDDGSDLDDVEDDGALESDGGDYDSGQEVDGPEESGPSCRDDLRLSDEPRGGSHVFLALPTTEGNKSWRETYHGTWFIQAFIYVVSKYANKEDLMTLMYKVNGLVRKAGGGSTNAQDQSKSERKSKKTKRKQKKKLLPSQIPEVTTNLNKRLFFFPGLQE